MNRIWLPQFIVCCMLAWALDRRNPYGYYIVLRWVCCAAFGYLASRAYASRQQEWVWILGVTAAIYNPIAPLHLTREVWSVVNLATIGIAAVSVFAVGSPRDCSASASPGSSS